MQETRLEERTYSVIREEFILGNVPSVRDDVEQRDEETDHDSESTEVDEPCRRLGSDLAENGTERRTRSRLRRGREYSRSDDHICDGENDELEDGDCVVAD